MRAKNGSEVYAIPISEKYLIYYSPRQRVSALVNHGAATALKRLLGNNGDSGILPEALQGLWQVLRESAAELPAECAGAIRPPFLGILPTRACNLYFTFCPVGVDTLIVSPDGRL